MLGSCSEVNYSIIKTSFHFYDRRNFRLLYFLFSLFYFLLFFLLFFFGFLLNFSFSSSLSSSFYGDLSSCSGWLLDFWFSGRLLFYCFFDFYFFFFLDFVLLVRIKLVMLYFSAGVSNLERKSVNSSIYNEKFNDL